MNLIRRWEGEIGAVGFEGVSFSFFPNWDFFSLYIINLAGRSCKLRCAGRAAPHFVVNDPKKTDGAQGLFTFLILDLCSYLAHNPVPGFGLVIPGTPKEVCIFEGHLQPACTQLERLEYLNISYLLICLYNWKVSEWNLPVFIKEQPDVVVLQGPLIEGGGISVVLHLEVGREGGVGHSAI
jgi:hypothetical protein